VKCLAKRRDRCLNREMGGLVREMGALRTCCNAAAKKSEVNGNFETGDSKQRFVTYLDTRQMVKKAQHVLKGTISKIDLFMIYEGQVFFSRSYDLASRVIFRVKKQK
jgi:hypothetical protein